MKTAIVTDVLPPTWSGQAMMLERLLQPFDPAAYVLISTMAPSTEPAFAPSLPGPVFSIHDGPASHSRGLLGKSRVSRGLRALRARTRQIAEIVEEEGCDTIVGCTGGDGLDIPAAWRASRRVGARFVAYYFDYWPQQLRSPTERRLADWTERLILRKGSSVIVTKRVPRSSSCRNCTESLALSCAMLVSSL